EASEHYERNEYARTSCGVRWSVALTSTSPPDPLSKKEGAPVLVLCSCRKVLGSPLFWRGAGGEVPASGEAREMLRCALHDGLFSRSNNSGAARYHGAEQRGQLIVQFLEALDIAEDFEHFGILQRVAELFEALVELALDVHFVEAEHGVVASQL